MKIVQLNASTLPVYRSELAGLLMDAVLHGASVGYKHPLAQEDAENHIRELTPAIAKNELLLWIARDERGIVGSIQLALCQKPNGQNRSEIQKLLVHSEGRRQGIGKSLITALERTAYGLQRGLLYLDTQAGSPAEAFYRAMGYRSLGEIPDYACTPDGYYHPTVIYYKRLFAANQQIRALAS
ncbi:GNAT family N-acetyltransferase [Sodalis ligni]|jgi:acetyltransferase|uniref:Ribosomal protein S18 acetylase RimI-like enzyme n=1 Tax=Sodalis ligni TaxID=2697027 RepID=A0A4R1NDK9_9GAMM|nr:GNAT family N-acetyltransferase [Sodalis ligni]QWA10993.1 GNAT family N-acetyltransferase [Sodalis ligni]TCL05644.1 ribosomal protein S18 acetylase RimI-like enzyme [Sodalis ligni]